LATAASPPATEPDGPAERAGEAVDNAAHVPVRRRERREKVQQKAQ
jgi:hypothetical protein